MEYFSVKLCLCSCVFLYINGQLCKNGKQYAIAEPPRKFLAAEKACTEKNLNFTDFDGQNEAGIQQLTEDCNIISLIQDDFWIKNSMRCTSLHSKDGKVTIVTRSCDDLLRVLCEISVGLPVSRRGAPTAPPTRPTLGSSPSIPSLFAPLKPETILPPVVFTGLSPAPKTTYGHIFGKPTPPSKHQTTSAFPSPKMSVSQLPSTSTSESPTTSTSELHTMSISQSLMISTSETTTTSTSESLSTSTSKFQTTSTSELPTTSTSKSLSTSTSKFPTTSISELPTTSTSKTTTTSTSELPMMSTSKSTTTSTSESLLTSTSKTTTTSTSEFLSTSTSKTTTTSTSEPKKTSNSQVLTTLKSESTTTQIFESPTTPTFEPSRTSGTSIPPTETRTLRYTTDKATVATNVEGSNTTRTCSPSVVGWVMVGSLMHSCHLSILLGHSDEIPPGIGKTNKVIYSDGSETLNLDVELPNTTQEQVVKAQGTSRVYDAAMHGLILDAGSRGNVLRTARHVTRVFNELVSLIP